MGKPLGMQPGQGWLDTGPGCRRRGVVQAGLMDCRSGCGACCIAPSISSPIPGLPAGKPAGIPCVHLLPDYRCALFGKPERPSVCVSLRPTNEMCGVSREEALQYLAALEQATMPAVSRPGRPNLPDAR